MKIRWLLALLAGLASPMALAGSLLGDAAVSAGNQAGGTVPGIGGSCPSGSTPRLTIVNNCSAEVFAVFTPGGNPTQPAALANSGAWFRTYADPANGGSGENYINTGAQGSGSLNSSTLTLTTPPGDTATYFHPGQFIKVTGGGSSGADLPTEITTVSGNALTLTDPLLSAVTNAVVWYNTLKGAVPVPIATTATPGQTFCIPDQGAPSGNFSFFMGCPGSDPFANQGCSIGAVAGDLAGVNTLFEPTFGCKPDTATCAFNAADSGATYPNCQTNPNSTNCGSLSSNDYFDVSAVDGYTMAMQVAVVPNSTVDGASCSSSLIDASMLDLASCPSEDATTLYPWPVSGAAISLLTVNGSINQACVAPYKWLGSGSFGNPLNPSPSMDSTCGPTGCTPYSYYAAAGCLDDTPAHAAIACPGGSGPQQRVGPAFNGTYAIQNTHWTQQLYAMGYTGYTSQYDDAVGGQQCSWGAAMTVTLCPGGSSKTPYDSTQKWVFDSGNCVISATGTYPSQVACLTDPTNAVLFTCDPLTDTAHQPVAGSLPFSSARWKADSTATSKNGYTWAQVQALKATPGALVCRNLTSAQLTPAGTSVTVRNCDYKYAPPYDPTDPAFAASSWCPAP
jgi:hypothetical protein